MYNFHLFELLMRMAPTFVRESYPRYQFSQTHGLYDYLTLLLRQILCLRNSLCLGPLPALYRSWRQSTAKPLRVQRSRAVFVIKSFIQTNSECTGESYLAYLALALTLHGPALSDLSSSSMITTVTMTTNIILTVTVTSTNLQKVFLRSCSSVKRRTKQDTEKTEKDVGWC